MTQPDEHPDEQPDQEPGTEPDEPNEREALREVEHEAELRQIDALNSGVADRLPPYDEPPPDPHPESGSQPEPGVPAERAAGDAPPATTPLRSGRGSPRLRDALLLEAGGALSEAGSVGEVIRVIASLSTPEFPFDGLIAFGVRDEHLHVLSQTGYQPGIERTFEMPLETGYPAAEVVRTGQPVYLRSPEEYQRRYPAIWPLIADRRRASWAYLPLVTSGRTTGALLAAFATPTAFDAGERAMLTTVARLVAQAAERAHTGDAELALSRGLRRSMGTGTPTVPGLSVATRYVPTGGGLVVGGDWYDIINLPTGRLALVIGDVQGHDVHAASLMAQLRTAVHAYAAEGHGPDAVLARTSRFLASLDAERFATCIYIEADPAAGTLSFARAGHPHPVLRLPDGTCTIKHVAGGLPLGLMPDDEDYPVSVMELQPDEVLLLCTDGLIETGGFDMYTGWVRVRDSLSPGPVSDLEGMAERLILAVHGPTALAEQGPLPRRNEDDIALLLVRRDSNAPRPEVPERRLALTIEQDRAEGLAEAREELKLLLFDWDQPDQVDTAVLLASELLANVLVHTDQPAGMVAAVTGTRPARELRIEVSDSGDELPHQRAPGELASSGRGLVLLELLSDRWGVQPNPYGKTVWFLLDESAEPTTPDL